MDANEMKTVLDALERINRSLDERFEKNADLYIAPEQVEKLKHLIRLGNYPQIVKECALKKYSANVLANVLIKNAWLMHKSQYFILQPIFDECDYSYLHAVMNDGVFSNKIEMPSGFRRQLLTTFLKRSSTKLCRKMLELNPPLLFLYDSELRAICVRQALAGEPILERYRLFNDYVKQSKNILQEKIVAELFPAEDFTNELRERIFKDHIESSTDATQFWMNRLSAADIPFIMAQFKNICRRNSSDWPFCQKVFGNLYPLCKYDFETFAKKFAEACDCMDDWRKEKLAQSFINRVQDNKQEKFLRDELDQYDITPKEKGNLADVDGIIKFMNEDTYPQFNKRISYLTASFDKKYHDDYENILEQIRSEVLSQRFEKFCLSLVKYKRFWQPDYLLYAIDHLVPDDADKNHPIVKELLEHIRDKNILKQQRDKNIGRVTDFVKAKDFDLFTQLKQF